MTSEKDRSKSIEVGAAAPDITIELAGVRTTLKSVWEKCPLLLLFYPLAFTPVCLEEFSGLIEAREEIEKAGIRILGVSVDSPSSARAFQDRLQSAGFIDFVGDQDRNFVESFGVLREEGFSDRASFLIDTSGTILDRRVEALMAKRTPDRIMEMVRHLGSRTA